MKSIVLHPTYFGSIAQYVAMTNADEIIFENEDNYQKQTYRNRMYVYGANGKLLLNIPIRHKGKGSRQKYKDVRIENDFQWQKLHWKSLETAYRTSPFFEYYEDELRPLFEKKKEFLLDFNYECMQVILDCLQLEVSYTKTQEYAIEIASPHTDLRPIVNAKHLTFELEKYTQVFDTKHGFLTDLCILDLLFNEGTNALPYLEKQSITL
ncbi:WbqC family protein [Aquimarina rhabdastrellae]